VRKPKYSAESIGYLRSQLDLSLTLNPEQLAAHDIYNILRFPSAVNIEKFASGSLEMMEFHLVENSLLDGLSLSELRLKFSAKFLVCAVRRGDDAYIPDGNFVLKSGDRVGIVATPHEFVRLLKQMGVHQKPIKSVMILGAGRISYYLTSMLTEAGISVKVIEKDERVAKSFAASHHRAVVINGDGAGQELLREEGIRSVDAFVALTGTDEQNILISTFALSENKHKVITKVNRSEFLAIADRLGLDSIVSSKTAVCDSVVSYARALQNSMGSKVDTVYQLMDEKVEALEFEVRPDFKYINIPFKELRTKDNILVAGIIRAREIIIPSGNDMILAGDKVVVFSAGHRLGDLSDIVK
jgi:trk system potassium uptake protein TrkA